MSDLNGLMEPLFLAQTHFCSRGRVHHLEEESKSTTQHETQSKPKKVLPTAEAPKKKGKETIEEELSKLTADLKKRELALIVKEEEAQRMAIIEQHEASFKKNIALVKEKFEETKEQKEQRLAANERNLKRIKDRMAR
mmetsp:Transcript_39637/g.60690  ORF Transcript_39637/g.60690 Transcript_39637/m.60690 type:complete len:138 (+) Transcript_39637:282-695(+)